MPTKEEVLKKFEELGYEIEFCTDNFIRIRENQTFKTITIFDSKTYMCHHYNTMITLTITMQEHQLLTELFKVFGGS